MSMARPAIAAVQFAPQLAQVEVNRTHTVELAEQAADMGASIVVLPECAITGYVFRCRDALLSIAEPVPGPTTEAWSSVARRRDIWIIGGIAEREADQVFNSAVTIGPDGVVGCYRKCHLWGIERDLYVAGSAPFLFDTPWGRIGLGICYDLWFPELGRALALAGADLIVYPANWSSNPRLSSPYDEHGLPLGCHMAIATACANELTVLCADRVGVEEGVPFLGCSIIVGPNGRAIAGPASKTDAEILLAEWPDSRRARSVGQSHLQSRREDLYALGELARHPGVAAGGRG